jgi:hypothetical protein
MVARSYKPAEHFTAFHSAREEASTRAPDSFAWDNARRKSLVETEAIYFSRRAREELRAGIDGNCRKTREVHFALAEAYEFRARVLTEELKCRGGAQQCHAL